jgi:GNAT superfamily N-acetyltransferase
MTIQNKNISSDASASTQIEIRPITVSDYERTSEVIVRCLMEVNIRDYGEEHIARMLPTFAPNNLATWFHGAETFVMTYANDVVGTGTLRGNEIQTVFVDPSNHGMGYGKRLMRHLENAARDRGVSEITLRSSLTSKGFYESLEYQAQGDTYGAVGGQMVVMTKKL